MHFFRLCKNERLLKTFTQKICISLGIHNSKKQKKNKRESKTKKCELDTKKMRKKLLAWFKSIDFHIENLSTHWEPAPKMSFSHQNENPLIQMTW